MYFWDILNGLYLIIWLLLLLHCISRRQFYPIFGRFWGTKALWLFTFVFYNPLLTLIYLVFEVLQRNFKIKKNTNQFSVGSLAVILSIVTVIILFKLPIVNNKQQPEVITRFSETANPESFLSSGINIGILNAKNKIQTLSTVSSETNAKINPGHILIFCNQSGELLDKIALQLQQLLLTLPYVEKVTYCPYGTNAAGKDILPDVFITLRHVGLDEQNIFRERILKINIECVAGNLMLSGNLDLPEIQSDPILNFNIQSELCHESRMFGIESQDAKYKLEAENIAQELMPSLAKQFEDLLDKYGRLPKLPDSVYGTYSNAPAPSFLRNSQILVSGRGFLKDNHTIWQLYDSRPTSQALQSYADELQSSGWTVKDKSDTYLLMSKDNEYFYIFRQRWKDIQQGYIILDGIEKNEYQMPIIVHYDSFWQSSRIDNLINSLLESDIYVETLPVFENYITKPEQTEKYNSILKTDTVPPAEGYLSLSRYHSGQVDIKNDKEYLLSEAIIAN